MRLPGRIVLELIAALLENVLLDDAFDLPLRAVQVGPPPRS